MKTRRKNRKYPRLKQKDIYSKPGTVAHVIIGTYEKQPCSSDHELAYHVCKIIEDLANEKDNSIYTYCVMPDHIHLLLDCSDRCGIIEFVKRAKGRFASYCRKNGKFVRLQRSFYDHILRREEEVYEVAKYIICNPVRAGIARNFGDYPFAGSLALDL